jgi:beta-lactamase class A
MAVPDLATQQVASARAGFALNVPEARQMILNALNSTEQRTVNLPIDEIAQGSVSVKSLANAVQQQLAAFTQVEGNVAGVFIKDLTTGEELTVNDDVAFSAQGWLKLALLVEVFRLTAEPTPPEVLTQLEAVALQGNNGMANSLLTTLGLGDPQTGVNQLNDTLRQLGLLSTFLAQPFGQDGLAANFVTPANSRENVPQTNPDPNAQATLAQVAALLEFVEQCRNGVGPLPLVFVGAFSPAKCTQILDLLTRNRINALIEAGSPGASVAHRQNWDANNHGDAALVRSAGRTYIIVVMLHSQQPLDWPNSSVVIANIARLTYALFNNQVPPAAAGIGTPPAP